MSAPQQLALMEPEEPPAPEAPRVKLTNAQRAAIDRRDRDVFTEAGAGSGKTGVLVERYCDCVIDDGLTPEAILAFTFTERAAGELRQRVRRRLMERARAAAEGGDRKLAQHITSAAREGERGWITTIHGFCRRVLATHPIAARLDPRFRVLDEAESTRLRAQAFDAALQQVVADGGAPAARFAAAFNGPRLRDTVTGIHELLRSQGADPPRLPDPGRPVRSNKDGDEARELTPREVRRAEDGLATVEALLAAHGREYGRLKSERSGTDFADLELSALELLSGTGPIREAWRERFAHVMVDEFQDTNRVQLALIDALCGPETRLFVVGDEFQSIYRFRHADLDVFRERRASAATDPGIAELPLRGNFRSSPAVLAAVDFMGHTMFGEAFAPLEAGREPVQNPSEPPVTELLITDTSGDRAGRGWRADDVELEPPPGETNPAYVAEARFLAQRLAELRSEGVKRGDMVVLLRAFTHVDTFEEALARADLAPYVVGGRGYWSQQQVEDVIRLLGVIANPLDDEILFGALASPACGVSADALWLLRQGAHDDEGRPRHVWPTIAEATPAEIPAADAQRLERFRDVLTGLRGEAPLLPLDALVDRVITAFGYDLAILEMKDGPHRMANVRKLMRLAAEYEEHDGRDLRGFLDFAEERTRRDEREGMAAVQVEGHDGVRVMTVHAAKGLEFPVVAVADMGRGLGMGFQNPDIIVGRLREVGDPTGAPFGMRLPVAAGESLRLWQLVELCDAESAAEVEEALRLTYVAATRAQERLILSGSCNLPADEAPESLRRGHSALQVLLPALRARGWTGEAGEIELPRAPAVGGGEAGGPAPRIRVEVQRPSADRAKDLRARFEGPTEPLPVPGGPSAPLLADAAAPQGTGHLSYSALASYAACGYRFYVERILGLSSPADTAATDADADAREEGVEADELADPALGARSRSLAIGSAVHAVLEAAARRGWQPPPGDGEVERILVREGLAGDAPARERVIALVDGWLDSELRATLAGDGARVRPEVPFLLELGGTIVRGKIDLLARTAHGPLVVDYKTDALAGADPAEVAGRYEIQRDIYAVAVQRATGTGPGAIRAAYCFLEEPERTVVESYDGPRLQAARERVEGLIARIRAGEFVRTDAPHIALCHGCPAAARLCGNPAWKPQWAAAS